MLIKAPRRTTAGDLYVGRAIGESKRVARLLDADLYVVSAGLGLVRETDLVPNYDLSAGVRGGNRQGGVSISGEYSTQWWAALAQNSETGRLLADVVRALPHRMVHVALPASYLRMVSEDLNSIERNTAQLLRIFTSEAGRAMVPDHLQHCILPYDERLETLGGYDGTRAEFPQRALRHFVEVLGGDQLALSDACVAVTTALAKLERRTTPIRQKMTDAQIASLLRSQWTSYGGSSGRLLRYLRDEALVACEQSRFRMLWLQVQAEHQTRERISRDR